MAIVHFRRREELIDPALAAGIAVPPDIDRVNYEEFQRFRTFCNLQMNRDMPNVHCVWHNAHIVKNLTDGELHNLTWPMMKAKGFIRIW